MKALILNSGLGKRMGDLTQDRPKCMVEICDGYAAIDFQLEKLLKCGVTNIVMTTGPFDDKLQSHIKARYPQADVTYVNNPVYDKTNYIYSIYLAKEYLMEDDIISLHGDLVFETKALKKILEADGSAMAIDSDLELPEKDFKAVCEDGLVKKVGIEFFENAYAAQPLYKLKKSDWKTWLASIISFCEKGDRTVYAENALNKVSDQTKIEAKDLKGLCCSEIDNLEDLEAARKHIHILADKEEN